MHRPLVAASLLVLSFAPAVAEDCPVKSMAPAEVEKLILAAPSCEQGLKIFQSCGMGGTSDVIVGAVVVVKCEAVFEGKLSARQQRAYDRAQAACDKKYASESGSMYRSLTAFCSAEAAARMAKQVSKTVPATPAKK
ncbi:hypothetical protein [Bradyrhizobium sp. LHD-71]|uniref:hypothetical protein n=1 Tax=Bradyrhizobium sp. LHD-71 TaxID=3072141 RepID=UPI00280E2E47|nr:hypothetical protein [Bradyrhizobium sp. LHD-71]MDQ8732233.1 hypothetical protein [Bradyrhizobium sp. LHD-71]